MTATTVSTPPLPPRVSFPVGTLHVPSKEARTYSTAQTVVVTWIAIHCSRDCSTRLSVEHNPAFLGHAAPRGHQAALSTHSKVTVRLAGWCCACKPSPSMHGCRRSWGRCGGGRLQRRGAPAWPPASTSPTCCSLSRDASSGDGLLVVRCVRRRCACAILTSRLPCRSNLNRVKHVRLPGLFLWQSTLSEFFAGACFCEFS